VAGFVITLWLGLLCEGGAVAVDALVPDLGSSKIPDQDTLTELAQLPLPPGRSYVVFATGTVRSKLQISVGLQLDAFDATAQTSVVGGVADDLETTFAAGFALTIATTLPPDPDLFVVARLSAWTDGTGYIPTILGIKIVALSVDSLSITTA
jgi:hypothetical protein